MKKAQWKKDPRERAFGKDPREALNDELTAALKKANDIIQDQNRRLGWLKKHLEERQERVQALNKYRHAYMRLRNMGVVLTHNEEFKHLKEDDMDAFFDIDLGPRVPTETGLRAMVYEQINAQFKNAYYGHRQATLSGTSATQVFYDDKTDTLPWLPPQKP